MHPALIIACGPLGSLAGTVSVALVWGLVDVYVLGHVDPKFGQFGTVQIVLLVANLGGLAGAFGACPAYWLLLRRIGLLKPLALLLSGMAAGVPVAVCFYWLLRLDFSPLSDMAGLVGVMALAGFVFNLASVIFLVRFFCVVSGGRRQ